MNKQDKEAYYVKKDNFTSKLSRKMRMLEVIDATLMMGMHWMAANKIL